MMASQIAIVQADPSPITIPGFKAGRGVEAMGEKREAPAFG
jgi:hypothetical protein